MLSITATQNSANARVPHKNQRYFVGATLPGSKNTAFLAATPTEVIAIVSGRWE